MCDEHRARAVIFKRPASAISTPTRGILARNRNSNNCVYVLPPTSIRIDHIIFAGGKFCLSLINRISKNETHHCRIFISMAVASVHRERHGTLLARPAGAPRLFRRASCGASRVSIKCPASKNYAVAQLSIHAPTRGFDRIIALKPTRRVTTHKCRAIACAHRAVLSGRGWGNLPTPREYRRNRQPKIINNHQRTQPEITSKRLTSSRENEMIVPARSRRMR